MRIAKLENVSFTYPHGGVPALHNISMEIDAGEFIAVMGENGAGKTTFCKLFNGVIPHSHNGFLEGGVWVDGKITAEAAIADLSSSVAVVLDEIDAQLFTARVRDEAAFGPENLNLPPDEIELRVTRALEATGLLEYADRPPSALSGGQKQRLAIASALAMSPRLLVMDEPTSQLDPSGAREVLSCIRAIREGGRLTVIMATHNSEEAAEFADKVCVLRQGKLAAFGTPREIFRDTKLLSDNGIRPPDVCALASYLADRERPLPFFPLDLDEAKTAVLRLMGNV
ncbi:MAG TPA: energy-coupling factor ABC transporter ATP-binding protein [Treponema sp.]|nr:energy-coupling factor ABC transporter ATP-binding protein [Treponema sp.]